MINAYMKTKARPIGGTDENVVPVDSSMPDLGLNDQLFLFFQKYKVGLLLVILATVVLVLGYYGLEVYKKAQLGMLQDHYQRVHKDPVGLLDFAENNHGKPLSGFAYLTLADQAYSEGNYSTSENHYLRAVENLPMAIMRNRAQLGVAMSQIDAGRVNEGKEVLQALLNDLSAVSNFRAKAAYKLIILLLSEDRDDEAASILKEMKVDSGNGSLEQTFWFNRANRLFD